MVPYVIGQLLKKKYLIHRNVYNRVMEWHNQQQSGRPAHGDTLASNVHGAAQLNHIKMAEGARLTIKPNRALTVSNDGAKEEEKFARKSATTAAGRVAKQQEKELRDEDETDVPFVVGDTEVDLDEDSDAQAAAAEQGVEAEQVSLPPVISGVTSATQTKPKPSSETLSTQTEPGSMGRAMATQTTSPACSSLATMAVPLSQDMTTQTESRTLPSSTTTAIQTDPIAKFNLKDMSDLRKWALMNWTTIKRAQRGGANASTRAVPYAVLNDNVPVQDKVDMLRKVTDMQLQSILGKQKDLPSAPSIASVRITPSRAGVPRLEDLVQVGSKDKMGVKKSPISKGKQRAKVAETMKMVVDGAKRESSNSCRNIRKSIQNTLVTEEDEDWWDHLIQQEDQEMREEKKRGKRKMESKQSGSSPVKKRQTRSWMRKQKAEAAEEVDTQALIMDGLVTLQGKQQKGKRAATEMEWPEEIEIKSGRSAAKGRRKD